MGQNDYQQPGWGGEQWGQQPQWPQQGQPPQWPQQPYPPQAPQWPGQPPQAPQWPQQQPGWEQQPPQWPQQPYPPQAPEWPGQPPQQPWGGPPAQPVPGVPTGVKQVNVYVQSDAETTMVHVDRYPFRMGRDSASVELRLIDRKASRVHAQLFLYENGLYVEDLGSSNGTWMNGQRLTGPTELRSGDEFRIGTCRITVEIYEE